MEVKPGYKLTEVGVIPSDWEVRKIRDCTEYVDYRGKTPRKSETGVLLVTARNIRAGFIDYAISQEFISPAEYEQTMQRGKPVIGDVLITTEAPLGMVAIVNREDVALAQRVIKYRANASLLTSAYLKFYFLSPTFQRILDQNSSGTTAKGIKGSRLHQLAVLLPPLREQEAIAEALSDADALIESLEKLIEKKRAIKQGAMQELLTGKRRLPGFTGKWEEKRLGEVAEIRDGTHQTPEYVGAGVPFLSVEQVTSDDFTRTKFISEMAHRALTKNFRIEKGDILMTRIGSIGVCRLVDWDFEASFYVSLALLKIRSGYSAAFIAHYSNSVQFKDEVDLHSLQSAIPKKINLGAISNVIIRLPVSLEEQEAIAAVISDLHADIAALALRILKTQHIKQGMMQELLTGRVRLL